jgi:hypothetical protein
MSGKMDYEMKGLQRIFEWEFAALSNISEGWEEEN